MKIGHIVVLCAAVFFAASFGLFAIRLAIKKIQSGDTGNIETASHTEIKILRGKIDDADCSITLAVATKNATDQDYVQLVPRIENGFRVAVAFIFDSEEFAVYPKTAMGGFSESKPMSHIVATVTCVPGREPEIVRYSPNMATGAPRNVFRKPSR